MSEGHSAAKSIAVLMALPMLSLDGVFPVNVRVIKAYCNFVIVIVLQLPRTRATAIIVTVVIIMSL